MSESQSINGLMKTHNCGQLRSDNIGQAVKLCGWVNKYRDLGGLHFIDLRDKTGLTQLGFEHFKGDIAVLKDCSLESVLLISGTVKARPDNALNNQMATGEIEVQVEFLEILSKAEIPPFLPYGQIESSEDLKLRYRYLDLRTKRLQDILQLRSQTVARVRNFLSQQEFTEIETPILYKTTPEGARDYIVPSRVHKNKVYALPQSPQTLKQLLMIAGTDKYFQICKCFRDEDLRADRQPEFSQIDIEVSFATVDYMYNLASQLVMTIFNKGKGYQIPKMSYDQAILRYGTDKPDTRFKLEHHQVTNLFEKSSFKLFADIANGNGLVKAIFLPDSCGQLARKDIDHLAKIVEPFGGKGVAWFKVSDGNVSGGISKFVDEQLLSELQSLDAGNGLWLFFADFTHSRAHDCADAVRRHLGKHLQLISSEDQEFLWVYDFPLLEWSEEDNRFAARHHPFTMPRLEDKELFFSNEKEALIQCKAQAYDLVCNGYEIAGGSMRIYNNQIQERMFELLGLSVEERERQFGFFIEALKYGTPPHGGMAFGLDRVIMILAKTENIRDVIAFPKTSSATDLMADSPSQPHEHQLKELHFKWRD